VQDVFPHCESLVRAADKDRFLATLFAPAELRGALHALYAANIEIARLREVVHEPLAGEIRLQWWREVIAGVRSAEAGGHPVASALLDTMQQHRIDPQPLQDLIDARTFDLYDEPMATLAELDSYARRTSSGLITLAAGILAPERSAPEAAEAAGIAYAITGLLRAFPLHASRRQLFVPEEILAREGVDTASIFAGHSSPGLLAALKALRTHARAHLTTARAAIAAVPLAQVPALLPTALVRGYLDRMERRDYDPFRTDVDVPQWRRQWVLWRAARRAAAAVGS
jgi:15-cis-phytoene synthase